MLKSEEPFPAKITTPVIAPGPVINGTPIGLIANSSLSLNSSLSDWVVLDLPTCASSILKPLRKKIIPPIIWKASTVIP